MSSPSVTRTEEPEPKAANGMNSRAAGVEATRVSNADRPHQSFPYLNKYIKSNHFPNNRRARKRLGRRLREHPEILQTGNGVGDHSGETSKKLRKGKS